MKVLVVKIDHGSLEMWKVLFHGVAKLHQSLTDENIDYSVRVDCSQGVKSLIHKYFKYLGSYRRMECFPFKSVKCTPSILIQIECVLLFFEVLNVLLRLSLKENEVGADKLHITIDRCFYPNTDPLRTISVFVCVCSLLISCNGVQLTGSLRSRRTQSTF